MDRTIIIQRLIEIDVIFNENKDNDIFMKYGDADKLRDEWVYLYNSLATQ